jgi:hypothetical protein
MEEDVQILPVSKVLSFTYDNTLGGSESAITVINNLTQQICYKIYTIRKDSFVVIPTKKIVPPKNKDTILIKLKCLSSEQKEAKDAKFKLVWCNYETKVYYLSVWRRY